MADGHANPHPHTDAYAHADVHWDDHADPDAHHDAHPHANPSGIHARQAVAASDSQARGELSAYLSVAQPTRATEWAIKAKVIAFP